MTQTGKHTTGRYSINTIRKQSKHEFHGADKLENGLGVEGVATERAYKTDLIIYNGQH